MHLQDRRAVSRMAADRRSLARARDGTVARNGKLAPSTHTTFGDRKNAERQKYTTDRIGAEAKRNERAVRTMRPAGDGRSGRRQETGHDHWSASVAALADLATPCVGEEATRREERKNPEFTPNTSLHPTRAGRIVSAGG